MHLVDVIDEDGLVQVLQFLVIAVVGIVDSVEEAEEVEEVLHLLVVFFFLESEALFDLDGLRANGCLLLKSDDSGSF